MTSASINNFVGDLVAMAQAMEELPKVKELLAFTDNKLTDALNTVQERETAILNYKQEIETLNQRIRSLEVERDDAGFRALELEDKASSVLAALGNILANVNDARLTLDPPKTEPVKAEYEVTYNDPANVDPGQSDLPPTPPTGATNIPITESGATSAPTNLNTASSVDVGNVDTASAGDPSPDTTTTRSLTEADIVEATKYKGVNYWTLPGWISETDWAAGGGDMSNYHLGSRNDPRFGEGSEVGPGF